MKIKFFSIILTLFIVVTIYLPTIFAEDYTQLALPKGAKARLGKGTIIDMRLSPDNTRLAIASSIGVWLYDVNTGAENVLLTKTTDLVGLLAFSPDGTMLAYSSGEKKCYIWDVESKKLLTTFNINESSFKSLKILADGKTLVSRDWKNTFSFWNLTTGELLDTFSPKASEIKIKGSIWERVLEGFVDSTGNVTFAIGNHDGTISIQDGLTHQQIRTLVARTNDAAFFKVGEDSRDKEKVKIKRIPPEPEEENDEKPFLTNYRTDGTPFPIQCQLQEYMPSRLDKQPMKWIKELKFSPDGKMLVSKSRYWILKLGGGSEGTSGPTEIWDVGTGEQLAALPWWVEVRFSGDSKTLALISRSAFTRGNCEIWDIVQKRKIAEFSSVADVKFSRDGRTLAISKSGSFDRNWNRIEKTRYLIWDITKQIEIASLIPAKQQFVFLPKNLLFSQDGTMLITADQGGTVDVWKTKAGMPPRTLITGYTKAFRSMTFSNDGAVLASGDNIGEICLWDTNSGSKLKTIGRSNVGGLIFSKDGKVLNAIGLSSTVQWNITTGKQIAAKTNPINFGSIAERTTIFDDGTTISFPIYVYSPNFRTLATKNGKENKIEIWDISTRIRLGTLSESAYRSAKRAMALTPDGNLLAASDRSNEVALWNTKTDKRIAKFNISKNLIGKVFDRLQGNSVHSLEFSHDGKTLAVGTENRKIQLWNVGTRKRVRILKTPHGYAICKLAFSPDGAFLASGDAGGGIHVWKSATGEHLVSYEGHKGNISALVFSPDRKVLASVSKYDGTIFLWDVPSK